MLYRGKSEIHKKCIKVSELFGEKTLMDSDQRGAALMAIIAAVEEITTP